jgi:predicted Fe-Mo cluster-binding NifX family protein
MSIKIAFPTDDGETISRHFGRADYFQVVTWADGAVQAKEMRQKPAHNHEHGHGHHHHDEEDEHGRVHLHEETPAHVHEAGHGHGRAHDDKFALLRDCDVFIGAGMGRPAYQRLEQMDLEIYVTGAKTIAEALAQYEAGTLISDMRRVHDHAH